MRTSQTGFTLPQVAIQYFPESIGYGQNHFIPFILRHSLRRRGPAFQMRVVNYGTFSLLPTLRSPLYIRFQKNGWSKAAIHVPPPTNHPNTGAPVFSMWFLQVRCGRMIPIRHHSYSWIAIYTTNFRHWSLHKHT